MSDLALQPRPHEGHQSDFWVVTAFPKHAPGSNAVVENQISRCVWRPKLIIEQPFTHEPEVVNGYQIPGQRTKKLGKFSEGTTLESTSDDGWDHRSQLAELKLHKTFADEACRVLTQNFGKR